MTQFKFGNIQIANNFIEAIENLCKFYNDLDNKDVAEIGQLVCDHFQSDDDAELMDVVEMIVLLARGREVCWTCGASPHASPCNCGKDQVLIA